MKEVLAIAKAEEGQKLGRSKLLSVCSIVNHNVVRRCRYIRFTESRSVVADFNYNARLT